MEPLPKELELNFTEQLAASLNIVPGPGGSIMKGGSFQSPNFNQGVSGWKIGANGQIEFRGGTIAGFTIGSSSIINDTMKFGIRSADGTYNVALWIGETETNRFKAPFRVTNAGAMIIEKVSGSNRVIEGRTTVSDVSTTRWQVVLGDSTSEAGSDAGTNFKINSHGDNGIYDFTPVMIERKTGNVVISAFGGTLPHASSLLEVQSTTKGVRFPNMTTAQRDAITPGAGTVIYNTTTAKLNVYTTAWEAITSA